MAEVVVIGSGFIGSAAATALRGVGLGVATVHAPRLPPTSGAPQTAAETWRSSHPEVFEQLCTSLDGASSVVNAAGLALPASRDRAALRAANAVLPLVLLTAVDAVGASTFLHVSSAAVQGRADPLDERPVWRPMSPYSESKAEGEREVLGARAASRRVVYRPTSVHGVGRVQTQSLARLEQLPFVPVLNPSPQVPLALVTNVAAAISHLLSSEVTEIVLHPWEGLHTNDVLELFAPGVRGVPLSGIPARWLKGTTGLFRKGATSAHARRIELLIFGQAQAATKLASSGFRLVETRSAWEALADAVRPRDEGDRGPDPSGNRRSARDEDSARSVKAPAIAAAVRRLRR